MQLTSGGFGPSAMTPKEGAPRYAGIWRDTVRAAGEAAVARVRDAWRTSSLYQVTLSGPMPDRILMTPEDLRPRSLEDADAMFRGRYRLPGGTVSAKNASIFDAPTPNETWAEELHSFEWVRHFAGVGGEPAAAHVRHAVADWIERFGRGNALAWRPHVTARRLIAWCAHQKLVFSGVDILWRSAVLHTMARQARHLQRTAAETPDGEPRLIAAIGLALLGVILPDGAQRLRKGLELTAAELRRQILPDGGHISRNPEALLRILVDLMTLASALKMQGRAVPEQLQVAIDRMAPMLRFFRHGDGRLALFNGGGEAAEKTIDAALARDDAQGRPFAYASHSKYQRVNAGRSILLMDVGGPPPPAFSTAAHAAPLSFEWSVGANRLVVNCGTTLLRGLEWREACRQSIAHSTLTLDGESPTALAAGLPATLLGARLVQDGAVESAREGDDSGTWIRAVNYGFVKAYGLEHERRIFIDSSGEDLRGEDVLHALPDAKRLVKRKQPFTLRFHIHPDVRISLAQDGASVILVPPTGEGWRFRAAGGPVTLEESVYLGAGDTVRRTEQIVVAGDFMGETLKVQWALKQMPQGETPR